MNPETNGTNFNINLPSQEESLMQKTAANQYQLGKIQEEQGQLKASISFYSQAVEISPETFEYCHRLGEVLHKINSPAQYQEAIILYQKIICQKPDLIWCHHFIGDLFKQKQDWEAAILSYQKALWLKPDFYWSHRFLIDIFSYQERWLEASQSYLRLVSLQLPEFAVCHSLGETLALANNRKLWCEAISIYQGWSQVNPNAYWLYHFQGDGLRQTEQWKEAIIAYRQAIELNQNFFFSHLFLGDCLKEIAEWEQAIVAYKQAKKQYQNVHNLLDLQKKLGYSNFHLGKTREKEGQCELAIDCYIESVSQVPESFLYHHCLGEKLETVNSVEQYQKAIAFYRKLTDSKPYLFVGYLFLGNIFRKTKQWQQAISNYRSAIELNSKFFWGHLFLVETLREIGKEQEALEAYKKVIELRSVLSRQENNLPYSFNSLKKLTPSSCESYLFLAEGATEQQEHEAAIIAYENIVKLNPIFLNKSEELGYAYLNWGMQLLTAHQLEQSLKCYEKALNLIEDSESLLNLQIGLANAYHNLAMSKAKQGLIQDACFLFSKAPEKFHSIEETCEYIWRGLNQLGSFDEQSIYCQKELEKDKAFEYFSNNSGYQVIDLSNLTAQDEMNLKKAGLSLNYLRLIEKNSLAFEEIAINSFSETEETRLSRKAKRNPPNLFKQNKLLIEKPEFQQSIVETGYIYCVCPFTGKILRSNQSFYNISIVPLFWYRFVSKEVFYLLVGESYGNKRAIYIPKLELIITFDGWSIKKDNYFDAINQLKTNFVLYWRDVQSYLENNKKDVACVLGIHNNIGHYLWNELTGIEYLAENEILDKINSFIVLPHEFFKFNCIFPESPEHKIIRIDEKESIFQIILANNYCAVFIGEVYIREKLVNRICSAAIRQCLPTVFSEVSKAKKHFPLIWIGIRTHHRVWVSQVDGIVNILKTLALTYPNLGVIFDGWSRIERDDPGATSTIEKELVLVESIIAQLPANLKTYSLIGSPTYEKVVWAQAIDLYICPAASTNLFVTWIANKVGVIHTNYTMSQEWLKEHTRARENIIEPVSVPINAIVDVPPVWHWCNYECDWKAIYDEVIKLLENINPER